MPRFILESYTIYIGVVFSKTKSAKVKISSNNLKFCLVFLWFLQSVKKFPVENSKVFISMLMYMRLILLGCHTLSVLMETWDILKIYKIFGRLRITQDILTFFFKIQDDSGSFDFFRIVLRFLKNLRANFF